MSLLSQKHLQNEDAAYEWVESHIWPHGAQCPHCCRTRSASPKWKAKPPDFGLYKCYACRKQFRVTVGTIFEKSHVPLHLWLQAFYLIAGIKEGHQRQPASPHLGVTLKTAWFVGHRIREAMRSGSLKPPMGGEGRSSRSTRPSTAALQATPRAASPLARTRRIRTSCSRSLSAAAPCAAITLQAAPLPRSFRL